MKAKRGVRQLITHLSDDDIEKTIINFNDLFQRWQDRKMIPDWDKCPVCFHPDRDVINRLLLKNNSFGSIGRRFLIKKFNRISVHHSRHLALAIIDTRFPATNKLSPEAEKVAFNPFPLNGTTRRQIRWTLEQFVFLKEIELDVITGRASPFVDISTKRYEDLLVRIRDTIMMIDRERKETIAARKPRDVSDEEWLTPQQQEEQRKLEEARQKKAQKLLEDMIHDAGQRAHDERREAPSPGEDEQNGDQASSPAG